VSNIATLYIVATPIGNLGDMSPRAVETLRTVAVIAAEDTRHSRVLFNHFAIQTPCVALHEHNESQMTEALTARLAGGESVALISDAGTPLISDPGFRLVRAAQEAGFKTVPIPGPSAVIAALSVSGLPSDRFAFEGFLPAKSAARRQALERLKGETRTLIFYESPHRIRATLEDMGSMFGGQRRAVLARELTKLYETVLNDDLSGLSERLARDPDQLRGEMVVLVHGAEIMTADERSIRTVLEPLVEELPLKQAVALTARITGVSRNAVYDLALRLRAESDEP
jgi:16S rRNA (cytidine1402-2'-O)-methyltransferase